MKLFLNRWVHHAGVCALSGLEAVVRFPRPAGHGDQSSTRDPDASFRALWGKSFWKHFAQVTGLTVVGVSANGAHLHAHLHAHPRVTRCRWRAREVRSMSSSVQKTALASAALWQEAVPLNPLLTLPLFNLPHNPPTNHNPEPAQQPWKWVYHLQHPHHPL